MLNRVAWLGVLLGILVVGAITYYIHQNQAAQTVETAAAPSPAAPAPPPEAIPETHYPVPAETPDENAAPLPALADSDSVFQSALEKLFGASSVASLLVPKELINRLVAAVDSLDRNAPLSLRLWPLRHIESTPAVSGTGDTLALSAPNAARYASYMAVLRA
ncbi:MAG: hypothetical protein ACRETW_05840, partial [Stenotrophobium sp.]